jgi:hypothetical protein
VFDEEKGAAEATPRETVSKLAIGWVSSPRDLRAVRSKPNPVRPQVHIPPREQFRRGVRRGLRVWRVPEF